MLDSLLGSAAERPYHIQWGEAQPVLPAAHGGVCRPGASFFRLTSSMHLLTAEVPAFSKQLQNCQCWGLWGFWLV